jgi:uncharacterized membrane protein
MSGDGDGPLDHVREEPTATVTLFILGLGLLALFAGISWFWMIFAIGFAVVVPLVAVLYEDWDGEDEEWSWEDGDTETQTDDAVLDDHDDPLAVLRDRYARGEITDEQFEWKLERLLETETVDSAENEYRELICQHE